MWAIKVANFKEHVLAVGVGFAVVGGTDGVVVGCGSTTVKFDALKGPMDPLFTASLSLARPSSVVTGRVKYTTKETITLPGL